MTVRPQQEQKITLSLPHQRSMRFVTEILEFNPQEKAGRFLIPIVGGKAYLNEDNEVETYWWVEMMAQGVAGLYRLLESPEKIKNFGYLVSISKLQLFNHRDSRGGQGLLEQSQANIDNEPPLMPLRLGDRVEITAKLLAEVYPFGSFLGRLTKNEQLLAEAEMTFYLPNEKGATN